jgi:hypothetical protein
MMTDDYILKGLHGDGRFSLPAATAERRVYFSHYYHPHHDGLRAMPHLYLVGFPLDSFYSDGIVYSDGENDPGPSGTRKRPERYVLRFRSPEWKLLEPRMRENADWLVAIGKDKRDLVIRYEDLFADFAASTERLARFCGGFVHPFPKPVMNPRRLYWTDCYAAAFDRPALAALWHHFAPAIERFYPEKLAALSAVI